MYTHKILTHDDCYFELLYHQPRFLNREKRQKNQLIINYMLTKFEYYFKEGNIISKYNHTIIRVK